MLKTLISVSTHPAKNEINKYIRFFENAGVDMFHCDVMDGNFVTDTAFSLELLKELKSQTTLPLDVHLMVKDVLKTAISYAENGANIVTVHYESFKNNKEIVKCLKKLRERKVLTGVSIKPSTSVESIIEVLPYCNVVLVMSVEPGASGQKFMPECLEKIKKLNQIKKEQHLKFLIEVDGGVNSENASQIVSAGANILVSGSFLYKASDVSKAVNSLKINN